MLHNAPGWNMFWRSGEVSVAAVVGDPPTNPAAAVGNV